MSEQTFNVVFRGEIIAGANELTVKANVAKLFKANDKVLERLFSGDPIAIKKDVDRAGAMKYRALMKQAGAICYALDANEPISKAGAPKTVAPSSTDQKSAQPSPSVSASASASASTSDSKTPAWSLAPAGSILVEAREMESIPMPDLSGITLADPGVDLIENPEQQVFEPIPDVSSIGLAPVGSDMGEIKRNEAAVIPDVSGIVLAPVGSDMGEIKRNEAAVIPDVSGIELAPRGVDLVEAAPEKKAPKVDISHLKLS